MSGDLGPGPRSRVRRMPELARYDERTVNAVLDEAPFCHVAGLINGEAISLPTMHVRVGRTLYFHGSRSNAMYAAILQSGRASVSAAIYDGLRLARSGFETSLAYRSVVLFGTVRMATATEIDAVLGLFVDRFTPGRSREVRKPNEVELRLTQVVALEIEEASVKLSAGSTADDPEDADRAIWSGVVPARLTYGAPVGSFDGAMATGGLTLPSSLVSLSEQPWTPLLIELLDQLNEIEPVDYREAASIVALRDRLTWGIDPFSETVDHRHVTASAFVVSSRGVLLHRHRVLNIWVQPGGHVDSGEMPLRAAIREVLEETGIEAVPISERPLFHVDYHLGPRGHTHYDLRFLLTANGDDPRPGPQESPDVFWFTHAEAQLRAEGALRPALVKLSEVLS